MKKADFRLLSHAGFARSKLGRLSKINGDKP
jgi:hypothetical protein